jgi:hypothetical protein
LNAEFEYCYGTEIGITLYAYYGGTAPYTVTYTVNSAKNLRGSLGYKVNIDGTQKVNGLNPEASQEARDTSAAVIAKTMQKYREGIVIVACAGMPYAGYVSRRGYNVFDTAKIKMVEGLKKMEDKMKRGAAV